MEGKFEEGEDGEDDVFVVEKVKKRHDDGAIWKGDVIYLID